MIRKCIFSSLKTFIGRECLNDFLFLKINYLYDTTMKSLFGLFVLAAFSAVVIDSCSPIITPVVPTTLKPDKTGGVMSKTDSNVYNYQLSCLCPFPLKIEGADTSQISYHDLTHLKDTIVYHLVIAKPKLPLTSGKYTGWLAITTIQPVTTELLKDTLRDTVIVP
jgi:hypothetical protein